MTMLTLLRQPRRGLVSDARGRTGDEHGLARHVDERVEAPYRPLPGERERVDRGEPRCRQSEWRPEQQAPPGRRPTFWFLGHRETVVAAVEAALLG